MSAKEIFQQIVIIGFCAYSFVVMYGIVRGEFKITETQHTFLYNNVDHDWLVYYAKTKNYPETDNITLTQYKLLIADYTAFLEVVEYLSSKIDADEKANDTVTLQTI